MELTPGIEGRLFVNSEQPLVIAEKLRDQTVICQPVVDALKAEIHDLSIDVVAIDPFVSCHRVPENDNPAIDCVAKTWAAIARETNSAIDLAIHVRKPSGESSEFGVNDACGGSAQIDATRSNRVLNRMTKEEAERAGIPKEDRRRYFRVDKGEKDNMLPPMEKAEWHKIVSVHFGNQTDEFPEDSVGVVTKWTMPGALDGLTAADLLRVQTRIAQDQWRESDKADKWAGYAVAEVIGIDLNETGAKAKVKQMLDIWLKKGALKVAENGALAAQGQMHRGRPMGRLTAKSTPRHCGSGWLAQKTPKARGSGADSLKGVPHRRTRGTAAVCAAAVVLSAATEA
jgi:AAA domain